MSDECILLDSNILIYADQAESEQHGAAKELRDRGQLGEVPVCISPQILSEFFAVVTNPRRVTRPLMPADAMAEVEKYIRARHIRKIYPGTTILERMQHLFAEHPVRGPAIFDLFLVATMLENGIQKLYTFNTDDFLPFSEIEVLTPSPMQSPV